MAERVAGYRIGVDDDAWREERRAIFNFMCDCVRNSNASMTFRIQAARFVLEVASRGAV